MKNDFAQRTGVIYPIIQAPMLGVSTPEMAAAVSNEGGLGSLAIGGLSPERSQALIRQTKNLTGKPFAVNLFTHTIPPYEESKIVPMRRLLLEMAKERGYVLAESELQNFRFYTYKEQIDVLIKEDIKLISFTFGMLDDATIQLFKSNGCTLIGTATSLKEARLLQESGIDIIVAQGLEAGGHRGSFLDEEPLPQVGLFSLLPQLAKQVHVPVIAAGGIRDAQTMRAAFDLGAAAVQVGTLFIASKESDAIPAWQQQLSGVDATDILLTRAFSGRWARGIRNEMMERIEASGIPIPPYPIQNSLTAAFRKLAQQANDSSYTNLWAGQSAGDAPSDNTRDIFRFLVKELKG